MKLKVLFCISIFFGSYLSADTYLNNANASHPLEPQTEFEQLVVLMVKSNNGAQAINYAILQQDEAAVDLLITYGAHPSEGSLQCARRAGNLDLLKKVFNCGVRADSFDNDLLLNAIQYHQNDIARYLIEQGNSLGDFVLQDDRDYLKVCEQVENIEIYNLLASKGLGTK